MRPRIFAEAESGLSQPAAIASSGLRSIAQKKNFPPLSRTKSEPRKEINGGEVSATTTSKRGRLASRRVQFKKKLAKFTARRHLDVFPSANEGMRVMVMPFHLSRL